jgi:hypothetical protein
MCAIVKDEGAYLPEWITHHRLMGATRFYIYDNESKVPVSESVKPYDHGDITVIPFPGRGVQIKAYADAVSVVSGLSFWLAIMDPDEFLIPTRGKDVIEVLGEFEKNAALCVNWLMFGSSGHKTRPSGLQFDVYTKRNPESSKVNTHVKSIVRPGLVVRPQNPHSFVYSGGLSAVNERGVKVEGAFSDPVSVSKIRINHYFTRSQAEYVAKISKGDAGGAGSKDMTLFNCADQEATQQDWSACRFSANLKAALYNDRVVIP